MVPRVPYSLAPGPQTLSNAETERWSLRVSVILDEPLPHSASMKYIISSHSPSLGWSLTRKLSRNSKSVPESSHVFPNKSPPLTK